MKDLQKVVKKETVGNYLISTVFLSLDHNWSEEGPPLLFETMVFPDKGNVILEEDMERYSTWQEAEEGHKRMVEKYNV